MKTMLQDRAWVLLMAAAFIALMVMLRDWLIARKSERDSLLPKYTCPKCGRKSLMYGFGTGEDSLAGSMGTFHGRCTRCDYTKLHNG